MGLQFLNSTAMFFVCLRGKSRDPDPQPYSPRVNFASAHHGLRRQHFGAVGVFRSTTPSPIVRVILGVRLVASAQPLKVHHSRSDAGSDHDGKRTRRCVRGINS
jgi:hypothetical protein